MLTSFEIGCTRSGSHKIGFEERFVLRFHHVRTNPRLVALLCGAIAQLEERLICIQEVVGSIPSGSTKIKAPIAQLVEHFHGKEGVIGSNPIGSSITN